MDKKEQLQIIHGIRTGNEKTLKEFYRKNLPSIRKYIVHNSGTKNDVEDVFQDALIIMYQNLEKNTLKIECKIETYFYGICKNLWYSKLRKRTKTSNYEDVISQLEEPESILTNIEEEEKEFLYRKYFCRLSNTSQKVLQLFLEGNSMKEIAYKMNYKESYVRKKKFEAKKTLITMIEKDQMHAELKITLNKNSRTLNESKLALVG